MPSSRSQSPLGPIRCGIGVAHGTAVVGRLGTPDQFKIGVFGPTVNLAARLESLTRKFGVSILVDENCAGICGRRRRAWAAGCSGWPAFSRWA